MVGVSGCGGEYRMCVVFELHNFDTCGGTNPATGRIEGLCCVVWRGGNGSVAVLV
jgi:hypothetical protein